MSSPESCAAGASALGLGVELTLGALELALGKGAPEIQHSDQGLQYAATDYMARL